MPYRGSKKRKKTNNQMTELSNERKKERKKERKS